MSEVTPHDPHTTIPNHTGRAGRVHCRKPCGVLLMPEIYLVVKLGNTDIRYFHGAPTMNEAGYRETVKELNEKIEPATFRYILCDDDGNEIPQEVTTINHCKACSLCHQEPDGGTSCHCEEPRCPITGEAF